MGRAGDFRKDGQAFCPLLRNKPGNDVGTKWVRKEEPIIQPVCMIKLRNEGSGWRVGYSIHFSLCPTRRKEGEQGRVKVYAASSQ